MKITKLLKLSLPAFAVAPTDCQVALKHGQFTSPTTANRSPRVISASAVKMEHRIPAEEPRAECNTDAADTYTAGEMKSGIAIHS